MLRFYAPDPYSHLFSAPELSAAFTVSVLLLDLGSMKGTDP